MAGFKQAIGQPIPFLTSSWCTTERKENLMRNFHVLLLLLGAGFGYGQCGPYKHHPVWPDILGSAYVVPTDCDNGANVTGCLWDNGDTDWSTDGLSVGTHSVVLFAGSTPVESLNFEIEQLAWELNQSVFLYAGEMAVSISTELPYCPSQIFNGHHCPTDADSTEVYLLQNGVAIDSISPVHCLGMSHAWTFLPPGYSYQTYLVDHSVCGSFSYGEPVQTFSLEGAQLQIDMQAATGAPNGSIEVFDVVPDPDTQSPPPMPLTGELTLYTWPDEVTPVGPAQPGTQGSWVDLAAGEYLLVFASDQLCSPVDTVITVESITGISAADVRSATLRLWPVPTTDILHWSSGALANVWVTDLQGRVLITAHNVSQLDLSALVAGSYLLRMEDGRQQSFVKR